ncbi:M48 family metallopeptidase [Pseudomonas tohonis]|uniref:M48 family metallopeptidase n=1 Tax=Pseudomonas tohonis TaxID=2725477 RepID=UPI00255B6E02|nr:M48 family metallopeptidase [Pseudomonas tohonis]
MDSIYPPGPASVPANLSQPSASYRRQAMLAMAGLGAFILLYFSIAACFAWSSYRLINLALVDAKHAWICWLVGLCAGFLALFMIKALFFFKKGSDVPGLEIDAQQEPRLFEFLHRLADQAGAPRPHRVFLGDNVNAAVFYDLSLLNLLFPSKKNLIIGLGLVNVLTLSEFKAVLAHEFGHFGQKSMAVGRWVYVAQQIAAHIVAKRDALDKFLRMLSRTDIRVAWIGMALTLVVWSIRSLLETAFNLVLMAQRALSREMEFQADLVAVSLTGSDALVHALQKLQAADDAWDRALGFGYGELHEGRRVSDLFAVQSRVLEHMRQVLNDPGYGDVPQLPEKAREAHRVFQSEFAQPPKMWATHPQNHEREDNAKRLYVPAELDPRSAWCVFADAQAVREAMTRRLLQQEEDKEPVAQEDALQALDRQFALETLNSRYRGAYLGRSVVRHAANVAALYAPDLDDALGQLEQLYPESLHGQLEQLRALEREKALLEALRAGIYKAPGGVIRHRDRTLQPRELPAAIEAMRQECEAAQREIIDHDRRCRSAHRAAASRLQAGWDAYLESTLAVLHYADHCGASVRDAQGLLANVVAVVTADGKVSNRELKRVIKAGAELHRVLGGVYRQAGDVALNPELLGDLGIQSWAEALGHFQLPAPDKQNIGEWMNVIDGWTNALANALGQLRQAALIRLLQGEARVAEMLRSGEPAEAAPEASRVPPPFETLLPGSERQLQTRLGLWDRFQTADGFFPALARLVVAVSIVGVALMLGAALELFFF